MLWAPISPMVGIGWSWKATALSKLGRVPLPSHSFPSLCTAQFPWVECPQTLMTFVPWCPIVQPASLFFLCYITCLALQSWCWLVSSLIGLTGHFNWNHDIPNSTQRASWGCPPCRQVTHIHVLESQSQKGNLSSWKPVVLSPEFVGELVGRVLKGTPWHCWEISAFCLRDTCKFLRGACEPPKMLRIPGPIHPPPIYILMGMWD